MGTRKWVLGMKIGKGGTGNEDWEWVLGMKIGKRGTGNMKRSLGARERNWGSDRSREERFAIFYKALEMHQDIAFPHLTSPGDVKSRIIQIQRSAAGRQIQCQHLGVASAKGPVSRERCVCGVRPGKKSGSSGSDIRLKEIIEGFEGAL